MKQYQTELKPVKLHLLRLMGVLWLIEKLPFLKLKEPYRKMYEQFKFEKGGVVPQPE